MQLFCGGVRRYANYDPLLVDHCHSIKVSRQSIIVLKCTMFTAVYSYCPTIKIARNDTNNTINNTNMDSS